MFQSLIKPFLQYKYLLFQLVMREIKSRYKQSILGYGWVLLNPLMQLLVYSFVFSLIFRFPTNNTPYSIFLFIGLLPWIYLQTGISSAALSLIDHSDLLRKVYFPREILIYAVVAAKAIDLLFASLILVPFLFFYHIPIYHTVVLIIPLLFIQIILMTGISLIISTLNLLYRDIQYLVNLLLMMWMYFTPIVYPLSLVPKKWLFLYKLNPMVGLVEGYRSAVFNNPFDTGIIIWSALLSIVILALGIIIFKNLEGIFADIV